MQCVIISKKPQASNLQVLEREKSFAKENKII